MTLPLKTVRRKSGGILIMKLWKALAASRDSEVGEGQRSQKGERCTTRLAKASTKTSSGMEKLPIATHGF